MLTALMLLAQLQAGASWFEATEQGAPLTQGAIRAAAAEFIWEWRFTWDASETIRYSLSSGPLPTTVLRSGHGRRVPGDPDAADERNLILHCHPDGGSGFRRVDEFVIEAGVGKHAICPAWWLQTGNVPWDERFSIDAPIIPRLLTGVRAARDSLLALLDAGARRFPNDDWIAGQRVRFALDQGDTLRALKAATATCTAAHWWCTMLEGFVRYGRGEIPAVDTVFDRAVAAMPTDVRCEWNDLSAILDSAGRVAYRKRSCAQRDSVDRVLWWLSDPLYLEPGNDRRDEQFARHTAIALRDAIPVSERWDWAIDRGGGALREMLERYGWPAFSRWGGQANDRGHYGYLGIGVAPGDEEARFATAEYSPDRYHTVPLWAAIADPFLAEPEDWDVWQESGSRRIWWPTEHFPRAIPLVQPQAQVGLFRREHEALLAVAARLSAAVIGWPESDSMIVHLFTSTSPDSIAHTQTTLALLPTTVVQTPLASRPMIVSLELASRTDHMPVARIRFGATPPAPLTDMRSGDLDISRAVILRSLEPGALPPSDPARAIADMAASVVVRAGARIGIYWETYGVAAGDTVDITVSIARPHTRSRLETLGALIGRGGPRTDGVTIAWREPSSNHNVTTLPGRIPIQGRELSLDLAQVPAGSWTLSVSVARPGQPAVSQARTLRIVTPSR